MDSILAFFAQYGLPLTGIAIVGVIILGVLKYANVFQKLNEDTRHYVYLAISIGLSLIGTVIYMVCVGEFDMAKFMAIATAIYAINQTFYNIYKVTPLKELIVKLLNKIFGETKTA